MSASLSPVTPNTFQKSSNGATWQRAELEWTWQGMWTRLWLFEVFACLQVLASIERLWFLQSLVSVSRYKKHCDLQKKTGIIKHFFFFFLVGWEGEVFRAWALYSSDILEQLPVIPDIYKLWKQRDVTNSLSQQVSEITREVKLTQGQQSFTLSPFQFISSNSLFTLIVK